MPVNHHGVQSMSSSYQISFTKKVNSSLAKPPINLNGGLAKAGLTSIVKQANGVPNMNLLGILHYPHPSLFAHLSPHMVENGVGRYIV